MIRPALVVTALLLAAGAAHARGGPAMGLPHATTWKNSCAGVQALVARSGAAVLTFGPRTAAGLEGLLSGYDYDRVAHDARYCLPRATLTPIWVPTRDAAQCFAGYTCSESGSSSSGRHAR